MAVVRHKEAIHSGHFMISNFEAEAQDDEENIAVPVPEEGSNADITNDIMTEEEIVQNHFQPLVRFLNSSNMYSNNLIDASLNKLFKCMSIAYRQKLTSPKWNRFRGMKLRWKDKIRLNNVIWRCWHMQFIKGHRKLVCAFANPLEIDNHNKTEAGAILEGKYWKRKLATVTAEYKRWRIFYKQQHETCVTTTTAHHQLAGDHFMDATNTLYQYGTKDDADLEAMITDADFFVDALFNSLGSHSKTHENNDLSGTDLLPPNCQFQANIEELMDLDPLAPLQDWLTSKLPDGDQFLRGKSLTPDQDTLSLPLPDVKDIDALAESLCSPSNSLQQASTSFARDARHRSYSTSGSLSGCSTPVLVMNPTKMQLKGENIPSKVVTASQRKQMEASSKPVNGFKRGKLWSAAVKQHEEEQQLKREKERLAAEQNKQLIVQSQVQQEQQITHNQQQQQYQSQEELYMRQQAGSNLLLKQMTDQQQMMTEQKQQHLSLSNSMNKHQLEYKPSTVKLEDIDRQSSVKHSVIQPPQNQQIPAGMESNDFKASEYIRRPDPFEDGYNTKFDGFYALQTEEVPDAKLIDKTRRVSAPGGLPSNNYIIQGGQGGRLRTRNLETMQENEMSENSYQSQYSIDSQDHSVVNYYTIPGDNVRNAPMEEEINETPPEQGHNRIHESQLVHLLKDNRNQQQMRPTKLEVKGNRIRQQSTPPGSSGSVVINRRAGSVRIAIPPASPDHSAVTSSSGMGILQEFLPTSTTGHDHLPQPCFTIGASSATPNPGIADEKLSLAESKRKNTIKNGFDFLKALVPSLAQNPSLKISKAALLIKGAEYIQQLKDERGMINEEISQLRKTVETLTSDITQFQGTLASSGQANNAVHHIGRTDIERMFTQHVSSCTMQNWKYWVFSKLMNPLLISYDKTVSTNSFSDMTRTSSSWLDQHASQTQLRPMIMNQLKELCICTEILCEPHKMPQEALNAISEYNQKTKDSRMNYGQTTVDETFKFG